MRAALCSGLLVACVAVAAEPEKKADEAKPAEKKVETKAAPSAPRKDGEWSVNTGRTVGDGATVIYGQLGWPGVSATLLHGLGDSTDMGARFTFNYGWPVSTAIIPALGLQGVVRVNLLQQEKLDLGLEFSPGVLLSFAGWVMFGFTVPISAVLGIHVSEQFSLHAAVDLPFTFHITPAFTFTLPILFGTGMEFHLMPNFALTAGVRLGPGITAGGFGGGATFAFSVLVGGAYKF